MPDPEIFGVLLYLVAAVGLGVMILLLIRVITRWLKSNHPAPGKYDTYECGVPQIGSTRERFSVKFYLVALLFVLFDIETVFLVPYAVTYKHLGMQGFYGVLTFVAVLGLGLLYIIKRRALEWD
ncbi:MAG TPA: NADH-quinone oxidoreductase subunit A [Planctomycetota bacterium]|nr:NADH-quinone oxidoreductase subunit A [Planctomycetota bacterium]